MTPDAEPPSVFPSAEGQCVVVRVDMNVPLEGGHITDPTRVLESLPTLQTLLNDEPRQLHILTHIGRPKGRRVPELSTRVLLPLLEEHLGVKVAFREDLTASDAPVQLHENLRFFAGEESNDPAFRAQLRGLSPEKYVNDAFATSHRAHASMVGFHGQVPCYAGLLVLKEVRALSPYVIPEKRIIPGLTVVLGGAKMETKIPVLRQFTGVAEQMLIGGAVANTFLAAQGYDPGSSLYEAEMTDDAMEILLQAEQSGTGVHLPVDVRCADGLESPLVLDAPVEDVMGSMQMLDIGPHTIASFREIIAHSSAIICNGTMGVNTHPRFAAGTREIFTAIAKNSGTTLIGGGDSLEALQREDIDPQQFSHVCTGGGAMLEYLSGKPMPGLQGLENL
ncbi:phosphoglycerate kinase [Candidatus Peribacteria bacterium]|nr:phosphoglycerate kinase [Candidatus Peribacteria bacterium]